MRETIVKEGPLVFIRNVLVMEVAAAILLYIISFLENYEMLYKSLGADNVLRYDIFLVVAFSSFQLIYVSLLFFDWYFSYFEIKDREIIKKSGLIFKRRRSIDLASVASIETYESPLSRMIKHSTIILHHTNNTITKIRNVANAEEYVSIIKHMMRNLPDKKFLNNIKSLIKNGENSFLEFKETLRFDKNKNQVNKDLENAIIKTIVAFLNSEGGTLLIGVTDEGEIEGLTKDYKTLQRQDKDGFENHLSQLIKSMVGVSFSKYVNIEFENIDGSEICAVSVKPSHKPAYLKTPDQKEGFFIRVGNASHPLSMSEAEEYIKTHWNR